jgi:hypothetical protein
VWAGQRHPAARGGENGELAPHPSFGRVAVRTILLKYKRWHMRSLLLGCFRASLSAFSGFFDRVGNGGDNG